MKYYHKKHKWKEQYTESQILNQREFQRLEKELSNLRLYFEKPKANCLVQTDIKLQEFLQIKINSDNLTLYKQIVNI